MKISLVNLLLRSQGFDRYEVIRICDIDPRCCKMSLLPNDADKREDSSPAQETPDVLALTVREPDLAELLTRNADIVPMMMLLLSTDKLEVVSESGNAEFMLDHQNLIGLLEKSGFVNPRPGFGLMPDIGPGKSISILDHVPERTRHSRSPARGKT